MEFQVPEHVRELAEEAAELAREWSRRSPFPEDSWVVGYDPAFGRELAARRWIGLTWPVEHGGAGRSPLERFAIFEQLIANGAPIASIWFADRQIGPTILEYGTEEQRRRWLPDILDGTSMWCIGMSEPDNGSDLATIRTRAVPSGDGSGTWLIDGYKIWTSGAAHANWMYLVARTDPEARPHAGLSEFIVDMRSPGLSVRPIVDMTGNRHFCEVRLENVKVPEEHRVGRLHGSFQQMMRQMEHEHGGVDRLLSNRIVLDDLTRSGWLDSSNPQVRQELARIEIAYRIGRLLVLRVALGDAPDQFAAVTKVFCTELEQRVARFAASVAGSRALVWDPRGGLGSRIARAVAYAPAYTIMGGTSQILRNIIGERILGLPR